MLLGELVDTLLNLGTFGFVGAMVWLLTRPLKPTGDATKDEER